MRFTPDTLATIKASSDVLAIISEHVNLRVSGARHKGLCPLHTEKTPSFTVDVDAGRFYCFGCQANGDIIDFVQQTSGVSFVEAVETLAQRAGIDLPDQPDDQPEDPHTTVAALRRATVAAAYHYHQQLASPAGNDARMYLTGRGLNSDLADTWNLGWAPPNRTLLHDTLTAAGHHPDTLLAAGLIVAGDHGRYRDRFTSRLIFVINDHVGRPIGFAGRTLPGSPDHTPKYVNTAETPLYNKSQVLYGLDQALIEARRTTTLTLVEGYTDVLALHQAGIANVAATCGTSLTDDHVALVRRLGIRRLILAFDPDQAGEQAVRRAFTRTCDTDLTVDVLPLPDSQDPADWARTTPTDQLHAAVAGTEPAGRWLIEQACRQHDLTVPEGRNQAAYATIRIVADLPSPSLRTEYLDHANRLGVSRDLLHRAAADQQVPLAATTTIITPSRNAPTSLAALRTHTQRDVLWVALRHPELLPDAWWTLTVDHFPHPTLANIYEVIETSGGVGIPFAQRVDTARQTRDATTISHLHRLWLRDPPLIDLEPATIELAVNTLIADHLDRQIAAATEALTEARDHYEVLLATLTDLQNQRAQIRLEPTITRR